MYSLTHKEPFARPCEHLRGVTAASAHLFLVGHPATPALIGIGLRLGPGGCGCWIEEALYLPACPVPLWWPPLWPVRPRQRTLLH